MQASSISTKLSPHTCAFSGHVSSQPPPHGDALRQPVQHPGIPPGVAQGAQAHAHHAVARGRQASAQARGREAADGEEITTEH